MSSLWNAPNPTEGAHEFIQFFVEALLAGGILARAFGHLLGVALVIQDDPDKIEVCYALEDDFAVHSPSISEWSQFQIRLWVSVIAFFMAGMSVGGIDWTHPLSSILVVNWAYVAADPLFGLLSR